MKRYDLKASFHTPQEILLRRIFCLVDQLQDDTISLLNGYQVKHGKKRTGNNSIEIEFVSFAFI